MYCGDARCPDGWMFSAAQMMVDGFKLLLINCDAKPVFNLNSFVMLQITDIE